MHVVRQGAVGTDFLVHTSQDLTGWDSLKLQFIRPDGTFAFEVEDGGDPEDVAPVGSETIGDLGWKDAVGSFPVDTPADLGIWSIIPIVTIGADVLPGAPSGQFKVISKYATS